MSQEVEKRLPHSDVEYGVIYLPKKAQPETLPREVCVVIDGKRIENVKIDKYGYLFLGKARMDNVGLKEGMMLHFKWVSDGELHIITDKGAAPSHEVIKEMIREIGAIKGFVAEVEYPVEDMRLDVVWKKVEDGGPSIVFEIQIRGNFYEALSKLKHAHDSWNSIPFLVTTEEYEEKAKRLVKGAFHEMRDAIKIVNWRSIWRLHEALKRTKEIEAEIGFSGLEP